LPSIAAADRASVEAERTERPPPSSGQVNRADGRVELQGDSIGDLGQ
jgi:hypothetical protein